MSILPADDPRHGTDAGYVAHRRSGFPACGSCIRAHAVANKRRGLASTPPRKVPALGTQRRVQALQALGWSRQRIAQAIGYTDQGALTYMMRADSLYPATAARIAEVYEQMSMVVPVGSGANRARTWAKRHGYLPPLAWDDIDDPNEQPSVDAYRPVKHWRNAELLAEWGHLRALGISDHEVARKLGVSVKALERATFRTSEAS